MYLLWKERGGRVENCCYHIESRTRRRHSLTLLSASLYRMAHCCWSNLHDRQKSELCLAELGRRFPNGPMSQFARNLQREIGAG